MHDRLIRHVKPVAAALAVLLSTAAVAPPTLAAEATAAPQQATLSATAAATVAALSRAELAATQDAAPAADTPRSFFKTRKGVVALLLFAGATTFTFVSKSRDRVKSQIRD